MVDEIEEVNEEVVPSAGAVIRSVRVDGLFGKHNVFVNLNLERPDVEPRIRILFDDNGRGKTTILKIIYHLLSWSKLEGHLQELARLPIDSAEIAFSDARLSFVRLEGDPGRCRVAITAAGNVSMPINFVVGREDPRVPGRLVLADSEVKSYLDVISELIPPPIFVSDDRAIRGDLLSGRKGKGSRASTYPEDRYPVYLRYSEPESLSSQLVDPNDELQEIFNQLSEAFVKDSFREQSPSRADDVYADMVSTIATDSLAKAPHRVDELVDRGRRILRSLDLAEKYGFVNLSQLRRVNGQLHKLRSNSKNKRMIATVLDPYFSTMEADAERLGPLVARIDRLVSTVNDFLSEKHMIFDVRSGVRIAAGSPSVVPRRGRSRPTRTRLLRPSELSSGERHLLLLFCSCMMARAGQTILVDEPELSLGIAWKRMLLGALLELTSEVEASLLVASHSVEIITPYRSSAIRVRSAG